MAKSRTLDDLASLTRRRFPRMVRLWGWVRHAKDDWRRTASLWGALLILAYLAVVPRAISYRSEFLVQGTDQKEVWEYVADFNNMPRLNPTIIQWNLVEDAESGNFDHWRYRVRYEEYLSNLPWVRNAGDALVEVIAPPANSPLARKHAHQMDASSGTYVIRSTHNTCFYGSLFCVPTKSEFHFMKAPENAGIGGPATLCVEDIKTTCSPLLYFLCRSEIRHQRQTIQQGLQRHFAS